jgi:hypothetical protein
MPIDAPTYSIVLVESEQVVPRGVSRQTWSVHHDGRWVAAGQVPGAVVSMLSSSRGIIWKRCVELRLVSGTRLELTQESPKPRKPKDVFDILTLDQGSSRLMRKIEHTVALDGQLIRVAR